jgi:YD repeat-containing protein
VVGTLVASGGTMLLTTADQRQYTFNSSGQLVTITDRNGNTQTLTYSGTPAALSKVTDSNGRYIQITYAGGLVASVQDSAGRTVSYSYTGGLLTSVTDVRGKTWSYGYGTSYNWLTSATDPLGNTLVATTYDTSSGRVSSQTDAAGKTVSYAWGTGSATGTATVTDQNGKGWTYYWDGAYRLTDEVDPTGVRQSWTYNTANDVVSTSTTGGGQTVGQQLATYDTNGNMLTHTDAWNWS